MNPNIQVAFISVLATAITTVGVIMSAIINNRRLSQKVVNIPDDHTLDEGDMLERLLALIEENERKERIIKNLRKTVRTLQAENADLRARL